MRVVSRFDVLFLARGSEPWRVTIGLLLIQIRSHRHQWQYLTFKTQVLRVT